MTRKMMGGLLAAAVGGAPAALVAQVATGTITGRVTERSGSQPIAAAQIQVVGTNRGTTTAENGNFRVAGVPAGTYQVRVLRIGFQAQTLSVQVTAGQTATLSVALVASATTLDVVTVTAAGTTSRAREQGSNVAVVSVDSQPLAAVNNFSSLLNGRTAGVTVTQSSGTTGTGSRVRIRGANSVNLSNEPLLIIDGVRIDPSANSSSIGVGGQQVSRLNDLKPEDIETFEVLKGPAATGLYGTQAANGVIQITTRRGSAGRPQWNAFGDLGLVRNFVDYPGNYTAYGKNASGQVLTAGSATAPRNAGNSGALCNLAAQAAGTCVVDSLTARTPLNVDGVSPIIPGNRNRIGASVRGGNEAARYYISTDGETEHGVFRSNALTRRNYRANVDATPVQGLNIGVSAGYLSSRLNQPQGDNNTNGLVPVGLLGGTVVCSQGTPCGQAGLASYDTTSRGYFNGNSPNALNQIRTTQAVERFTSSVNATYAPLNWLRLTATAGADVNSRDDQGLIPQNTVFTSANSILGSRTRNKFTIGTYTLNSSGQATFNPVRDLSAQTTLGVQYQRDNTVGNFAQGFGLLAGTGSLDGTSQQFSVGEDNFFSRTFGILVQQQFGWRDRLFLTGGIRGDRNSAFGQDLGFVTYPSGQLSYVVSDEDFFPKNRVVTSVKLRGAYGQSGLRPGVFDALTYFSPTVATVNGQSVNAFTIGGAGLQTLRPERINEAEGGFDLGFFNGRVSLEATYFAKASRDALIAFPLLSSAGGPSTQLQNIGRVTNKGLELSSTVNALDTRNVSLSAVFNFSTLVNKLVALRDPLQPVVGVFGLLNGNQGLVPGYPIGAYFHQPYTYSDANNDGIIVRSEVVIDTSSAFAGRYTGNTLPRRTFTFQPTLTLFRNVRVQALVDYRGGFHLYNATEQFRCSSIGNCRAAYDRTTPLARQAASVASGAGDLRGYIEKADFTKLRELSVNLSVPESLSRRYLRTRAVSLNLAGRNLGVWTKYTGLDPELNFGGQSGIGSAEFLTLPPVRFWVARVNVDF